MIVTSATEKGQVVIPADIRKKHNIAKGTKVAIFERDNEIILKPLLKKPIKDARGLFKKGNSALKVLIQDRKEEAAR
jgi:AbrB family looped-hinge helix DNA binding protein